MTRIGLDSNIMIYMAGIAHSPADESKIVSALAIVTRLRSAAEIIVPVQALGELFVVAKRSGCNAFEARQLVLDFADGTANPASSSSTMIDAIDLVTDHQLQLWDALILCAASEAGCSLLLSEDMQDGFVARGVTVVNPLADRLHPKLAALLPAG